MFHCLNWQTLKLYVTSLGAFIALDCLWIFFFMKDMYQEKLGVVSNMGSAGILDLKTLAAIAVWALIVKGIILFVLPRTHGSYWYALVKGGIYGLIVYGTYELTNYAVLPNWPTEIIGYDIAWGIFICAIITAFAVWMSKMCGCEHICSCNCKERR
ncbi:MAG: DUF2177 family protein [Candidatus Babeliaceae bacterium]|nr:DUF2177 family protein [Candidatus Babeliaceae bacterium]